MFSGPRKVYCLFIVQIFFLDHPLYSYQQGGSLTSWIFQALLILKRSIYLLLWVQYGKHSRREVDFICRCFSPELFWSTGLPNKDTEWPVTNELQINIFFFFCISMFHAIFGVYLHLKGIIWNSKLTGYLVYLFVELSNLRGLTEAKCAWLMERELS